MHLKKVFKVQLKGATVAAAACCSLAMGSPPGCLHLGVPRVARPGAQPWASAPPPEPTSIPFPLLALPNLI